MHRATSQVSEDYPQLISLAVHELRTPAGIVGGYLRMLLRDSDPPVSDRQRKMLEEAEKSYGRLVAMIADLSEISKLDAGLLAPKRLPVDVFSLVRDVAGDVHEASERGVRLAVRGDDAGAVITGDSDRLRSAFQAIFRAVLREQPGPCTVVVDRRVDAPDGQAFAVIVTAVEERVSTLAVDTGSDTRSQFDEKRGGLGLTLPLAKRVIEALGGEIWSPVLVAQPGTTAPVGLAVVVSMPVA
jgi:two-component system sensor histidine kinase KdpD